MLDSVDFLHVHIFRKIANFFIYLLVYFIYICLLDN